VIKIRAQRAHPLMNIINPKTASQPRHDDAGAYAPLPTKAPIAHMDSEEDGGENSQVNSARKGLQQQHEIQSGRGEKVDLTGEPGLLFCPEIVYEGIKASNKEAQRLMQVQKKNDYRKKNNFY
jgi:hypothetical protein